MKHEAMKDALKKMAAKRMSMKEGSPAEEASESPAEEAAEEKNEDLGLAPSTKNGGGKVAPKASGLMGNPLVKGQASPPVGGPMESGDAEINGMKKFDSYIPSTNDSKSLGSKVKENIKKAIAAKSKK